MNQLPELAPALPEIVLACAAMALLLIGAWRRDDATRLVSALSVGALIVVFVLLISMEPERAATFADMFVSDRFAIYMKGLVVIGSAVSIVMSLGFLYAERFARFEFPVLILLATVGMMMMISANDLIALYIGVELQSLSLYVLAAIQRDSQRASEAGLKYFVLGALSSGMLLYGCSLLYGFTGSTSFDGLAAALRETGHVPLGVLVGLAFLVAGLAFKISAVPFHMWTPDVYEGAPTPVTAFFAVAPKIAAMALLMRAMIAPFGDIGHDWQQIVAFISIASMTLGAFAAIGQSNIKRLMAYSSIGHVGFALVGLAAGNAEGYRGIVVYLSIYLAMTAGAFACILLMRRRGAAVEEIEQLAGLSRNHPLIAASLAIFMFSLAGVPPLAGFFGKFYVFLAAVNAKLYILAVIGMLASVVGAYYYLRIVKIMYFDAPAEPFERQIGGGMTAILGVSALFTLLFFIWPAPLLAGADAAAQALLRLP